MSLGHLGAFGTGFGSFSGSGRLPRLPSMILRFVGFGRPDISYRYFYNFILRNLARDCRHGSCLKGPEIEVPPTLTTVGLGTDRNPFLGWGCVFLPWFYQSRTHWLSFCRDIVCTVTGGYLVPKTTDHKALIQG
jgi:hypothetical protein